MLGVLVVWHGWLVGWLNAINYAKPMPFADDDDYVTGRLVTPRHNVVIMYQDKGVLHLLPLVIMLSVHLWIGEWANDKDGFGTK